MKLIISDKLLLRNPRLSIDNYFNGIDFSNFDNAQFKESIYLASPVLFEKLNTLNLDTPNSATLTILKYFLRSCFRCTPFGLFAGCSIVKWGNENSIVLPSPERFSRLNVPVLERIKQFLIEKKEIEGNIKFYSNNTLFILGNSYKYIESNVTYYGKSFSRSSVVNNSIIELMLNASKNGSTIEELISILISKGIGHDEGYNFIMTLIGNQLLISELEFIIADQTPFNRLISQLHSIKNDPKLDEIIGILIELEQLIQKIDDQESNNIEVHKQLVKKLSFFGEVEKNTCPIQTDLFYNNHKNKLDIQFSTILQEGINCLIILQRPLNDQNLYSFINIFKERYGEQELPLLKALDPDLGIGYPFHFTSNLPSYISHFDFNQEEQQLTFSKRDAILFKLIEISLKGNHMQIDISDEDISSLVPNKNILPASFPLVFKITDFERKQVYIESAGGSSASTLFGRFAYSQKEVLEMIIQIAQQEKINNPNVLFAEINFIPGGQLANVCIRPSGRDFEIPILTNSSRPIDQIIQLDDLHISIKNDRIVLRSKRLNKQIIPRLGCAYNYYLSDFPILKFLGDLQSHSIEKNLTFDWGPYFQGFRFLPRVNYKQSILSLATWRISNKEWTNVLIDPFSYSNIITFQKKWNLPRYVSLVENDLELFIDFENELSLKCFIDSCKGKDLIVLKEFLFDKDTIIKDLKGQRFENQFIGSIIKNEKTYPAVLDPEPTFIQKTKEMYTPGSEWVYFKFYCGEKIAEQILVDMIQPISDELISQGLISKWFFLRYKDPEHHLRVRFKLKNLKNYNEVIYISRKYFKALEDNGLIWKIQLDTYQREIVRYGRNTISSVEDIFFDDSVLILKLLNLLINQSDEQRLLNGIKLIDQVLIKFGLTQEEKYNFVEEVNIQYFSEFKVDKNKKIELDTIYRSLKIQLENIMKDTSFKDLTQQQITKLIKNRSIKFTSAIRKIKSINSQQNLCVSINDLMISLNHLTLNRLFIDSSRLQEMVIYYFLKKYYSSQKARK